MDVFKTKIIGPMKAILQYLRYQIKLRLHTNDYSVFQLPPNGRKPALSIEDGMMRCIMFNRKNEAKLLEILIAKCLLLTTLLWF